jgi:hypothetical protein
MEPIFNDFRKAYEIGDGYGLATTLSPLAPASEPDRLYNFYRSTNFNAVKGGLKSHIFNLSSFKLPVEEGNGWVDVYQAYWKAIGEILNAEAAARANTKVRLGHILEESYLSNITIMPQSWEPQISPSWNYLSKNVLSMPSWL